MTDTERLNTLRAVLHDPRLDELDIEARLMLIVMVLEADDIDGSLVWAPN